MKPWLYRYLFGAGIAMTASASVQDVPWWGLAITFTLIGIGAHGWSDHD